MYLHVHCANLSAINFYKHHGFEITETVKDYYTDVSPPDCHILEKQLTHEDYGLPESLQIKDEPEDAKNKK